MIKYFFYLLFFIPFICLSHGSDDYTNILNKLAQDACTSNQSRTITFNSGEFFFKTAPQPFSCALNILGDGIGSTTLIRQYDGDSFLFWKRGVDHSGGSIKNITIAAGEGTNHGIAILVEADKDNDNTINSYNRHTFTIDHVMIGRQSSINTSWDHGIYLDGSKNPDNSNGIAAGIRMTQISHTTISGTNVSQIYLNKARGPNLLNVDCFIPLNNSINGVILDNSTNGVKLDSRTCAWKFNDSESMWMLYNGIRYK